MTGDGKGCPGPAQPGLLTPDSPALLLDRGTGVAQEGLGDPVLQPRGAGGDTWRVLPTCSFYKGQKPRQRRGAGTEHRVLQSWSRVNGASDKLDMVVVLDQPLPSNKAAPGAAERRVGPPKPSPAPQ